MTAIIALVVMLALLLLGVPIAFALLGISIVIVLQQAGPAFALSLFTEAPREILANFSFTVAPMFILMGQLAGSLGLATDGYAAARRWLTGLRGGVLSATFLAGALFAAISGSSVASAALLGKIAVPELEKFGYDKPLSLGAIAAAGTLATLIPPSIMMVIFAIMTETSVGQLLIGGIVPGIVLTALMCGLLEVVGRVKPQLLPKIAEPVSWKSRFTALNKVLPIAVVFVLMFGGIYGGVFTPTAGGAVGAFLVFLLALYRRAGKGTIIQSVKSTVTTSSQLFFVVMGGMVFSKMLVLTGSVQSLLASTSSLPTPLIVLTIVIIYIVAGCMLDPVSMLVISVPLTFPIMRSLGFHDIQIGIMVILMVEIAVLTPPIGFNCFVVAGAAKVDPMVVFRGIRLYMVVLLVMVALVLLVPQLSVWLPSTMYK